MKNHRIKGWKINENNELEEVLEEKTEGKEPEVKENSVDYFTELNNIQFHEEFANGIKMAKTKLIMSGIAIAVEIFLIIKCNRKTIDIIPQRQKNRKR